MRVLFCSSLSVLNAPRADTLSGGKTKLAPTACLTTASIKLTK